MWLDRDLHKSNTLREISVKFVYGAHASLNNEKKIKIKIDCGLMDPEILFLYVKLSEIYSANVIFLISISHASLHFKSGQVSLVKQNHFFKRKIKYVNM